MHVELACAHIIVDWTAEGKDATISRQIENIDKDDSFPLCLGLFRTSAINGDGGRACLSDRFCPRRQVDPQPSVKIMV